MKKILYYLLILTVSFILLFILDFVSVKYLNSKPFMAIKDTDENSYVYSSILYKVYYCKDEQGVLTRNFEKTTSKFACPVVKKEVEKVFTIVETSADAYAETIETFYEDENYICQYNVIKSDNVNVLFKDGTSVNIKDVLEQKLINIELLIAEGIPCRGKINESN